MNERFRVLPRVHTRRFEDELVVLDLVAGRYFSLDAVGATIWDHLAGGKTQDEVVAAVVADYAVDEAIARADVRRIAAELVAAGLLEARA